MRRSYTTERKKKALETLEKSKSLSSAARKEGVEYSTLYNWTVQERNGSMDKKNKNSSHEFCFVCGEKCLSANAFFAHLRYKHPIIMDALKHKNIKEPGNFLRMSKQPKPREEIVKVIKDAMLDITEFRVQLQRNICLQIIKQLDEHEEMIKKLEEEEILRKKEEEERQKKEEEEKRKKEEEDHVMNKKRKSDDHDDEFSLTKRLMMNQRELFELKMEKLNEERLNFEKRMQEEIDKKIKPMTLAMKNKERDLEKQKKELDVLISSYKKELSKKIGSNTSSLELIIPPTTTSCSPSLSAGTRIFPPSRSSLSNATTTAVVTPHTTVPSSNSN